MLEIKESNPIKIGKLTKTIISIKKTKSELTTNDLIRIRNKALKEGNKKHKHCEIQITKVYLISGLHIKTKLNLMNISLI